MRQVIVIHGAESFATYQEFWQFMSDTVVHLDRLKLRDWKSNLTSALGEEYDVIAPRMPNSLNAKYAEWKLWFEKLIPQLTKDVILVGHSMGGAFIAKYLSGNDAPISIHATFLVAAPFDRDGDHVLHEFAIMDDLSGFLRQGGRIFLYHSIDDPVVEPGEMRKYKELMPNATVRMFSDREHFNQDELPELVEDIRALS